MRRFKPYPAAECVPHPNPAHAGHGWELAIHGDLTDKQSDLVSRLLEVPRKSKGTIFFDSCGGSAYVGLALASFTLAPRVAGRCRRRWGNVRRRR